MQISIFFYQVTLGTFMNIKNKCTLVTQSWIYKAHLELWFGFCGKNSVAAGGGIYGNVKADVRKRIRTMFLFFIFHNIATSWKRRNSFHPLYLGCLQLASFETSELRRSWMETVRRARSGNFKVKACHDGRRCRPTVKVSVHLIGLLHNISINRSR